MADDDRKVGTTDEGDDCGLCLKRDGYCQWHGPDRRGPNYDFSDTVRKEVKFLAASGWSKKDLADGLDIAVKTLENHFADELEAGEAKAVAKVAEGFFEAAKSGGHPKASLDWLERRDPEHWLPADERGTTAGDDDQVETNEDGEEIWDVQMPDEGVAR